jgi:hypothetical protein
MCGRWCLEYAEVCDVCPLSLHRGAEAELEIHNLKQVQHSAILLVAKTVETAEECHIILGL